MKIRDVKTGLQNRPLKAYRKHPGFRKNFSLYFSDYGESTSIHGIQYLGERKRSLTEKLCWLVVLSISVSLCAYLIVQAYQRWKTSPTVTNFSRSTPVWQVPFPAITVCPETKSRQRVYNFTEAYLKYLEQRDNMTAEEMMQFEQVSLVCDSHLYPEGNKTIGYDTIDFLAKIAPQFGDVLWQCKWLNQNRTCEDLLTPILTEEGVCYTFNMLDKKELFNNIVFNYNDFLQHGFTSTGWTLEKGYPKNQGRNTFPRRSIAAGQRACFSLLMTLYEPDLDYICRGPVQGFKVLVHNSFELPRAYERYFRAPLNHEIVVNVKPDLTTTSKTLKSYDPHSRQCYFSYERFLKYFKIYTQRNCEFECFTNYTLKRCGCVAFYMPHERETNICGAGSVICVYAALEETRENDFLENVDDISHTAAQRACNCLPSCTTLTYNVEISQNEIYWQKVFEAFQVDFNEFPGVAMTSMTFFFKDHQFIASERTERYELYSITDFIANCGGLLGVFTGFSFISIVEILYFLSLRLFCNIRKHGRHFWAGYPETCSDSESLGQDTNARNTSKPHLKFDEPKKLPSIVRTNTF